MSQLELQLRLSVIHADLTKLARELGPDRAGVIRWAARLLKLATRSASVS